MTIYSQIEVFGTLSVINWNLMKNKLSALYNI